MALTRLLDCYCKAGGAAMGYWRAGFEVTGVDIEPQSRFPFDFIQGDAVEYIMAHGHEYDAIHASPPCQPHSRLAFVPRRDMSRYPDLIAATRAALVASGRPYVIENVEGAPLHQPIMLCGTMFGLRVFRHRLFECSWWFLTPPHGKHRERVNGGNDGKRLAYYTSQAGAMVTVAGHLFSRAAGATARGIDWMTRDELSQAIPPAYTEFIGAALLRHLAERVAVA